MKPTQKAIAQRARVDISTVNKILRRVPGPVFRKETIEKVWKTAREMGYEFDRIKVPHLRRHPRMEVSIRTEIRLYAKNGDLHDQGTATIQNISLGGAWLEDLKLPRGTMPVGPFRVIFRPLKGILARTEFEGWVIRIRTHGQIGFGVSFGDVSPGAEARLAKLAKNLRVFE